MDLDFWVVEIESRSGDVGFLFVENNDVKFEVDVFFKF